MDYSNWNVPSLPALNSAPPPRRPKRRKIAVACEECRARKVRCDGQQPACGPCLDRAEHHGGGNANCVYSGNASNRNGGRERDFSRTIDSEGRPQVAQEQMQRHVQTPQSEPQRFSRGFAEGGASTSSVERPILAYHDIISPASSQNVQFGSIGHQRRVNSPIGVNAMVGEMAADERQQTNGFFGSSSAGGFMRQIRIAVNKEVPSGITSTGSLLFPPLAAKEQSALSSMSNHVLPQRRLADRMMEIYWNIVFPLYPFFDREQLNADYMKIWNGEEASPRDEEMLMCTFNLIFALGCQLSESIKSEDRAAAAGSFFSRAQELLQLNLWHSGSTALIQCLLLMAQYLQSTDCADQCWMVTGMAIRSAQGLGLHLPETSSRIDSVQGKELARRVWHGCVLMDCVVALTLGRPAMISKEAAGAVPLPTMADEDESSSTEPISSPNKEKLSFIAFYARSLELYEIMNDILLGIYKNQTPPDRPEDLQKYYFKSFYEGQLAVFKLDNALTSWSQSLPAYFSSQSNSSENRIINRQSVVLRLRYLHVRMVLLRPILSKYSDLYTRAPSISSDDSLPQRFALQCSIICVKSAQDVINMVHTHLPHDDSIGLLPAWWYNILYVYTAATVLIAGLLHKAVISELTEEGVAQTWHRAIEILRKYQSYSSSAQRCIVVLELLYEQVSSSSVPTGSHCVPPTSHHPAHDVSLGEGLSAAILDSFDMPDFFDMSWLNSVPSSLY